MRHIWGERFKDKGNDEIMALDAEKEVYYRQALAEHFPEMPGASALLRQLHDAGFALAIGSSGPPENVAAVLAGLPDGTGKFFGATVNGIDVTRGKPDPAIFLLAARRLGVAPACCAVVEDAPAGIAAAKAAGMAAIAVTGTAPPEQLAEADLIINSLTQLNPSNIGELIDNRRNAR